MNNHNETPTPEQFGLNGTGGIVYVRSVRAADLGDEIQTPEGIDTLYAVHDQAGRRLALFDNRDMAFAIAKSNDLFPMSVH